MRIGPSWLLTALAPLVALAGLGLAVRLPAPAAAEDATPLRRPVAVALTDGGRSLLVANRSGSVSIIDPEKRAVVAEKAVGRQLADLAALPDGRLLAVDERASELVLLSAKLERLYRLPIATGPVSVTITANGTQAVVASLWGRQLSFVEVNPKTLRLTRILSLPFAPRQMLHLGEEKSLIVADAFGGRLAVVGLLKGDLVSVRDIPASNVGGLARSANGQDLLMTHQVISRLARTTRDDIHWGNLVANYLRVIPLREVLRPEADLVAASRLFPVGDFGHGTGDPAGVATTADGTAVMAFAGVGEVGVGVPGDDRVRYFRVGRRPTAVAVAPDGRRAFVANTFSDSVSLIDLPQGKAVTEVSLGTVRPLTAAERGELLFHNARLTHDGWFSCHSCHTDGHSNGQLADTLGDGAYGAPKRVPSLLGVADTAPYAWNGSKADLESQLRQSIRTTMHGLEPSPEQLSDLIAYLRTLKPPPPHRTSGDGDGERGRQVFLARGCGNCHTPPTYTSPKKYDVGLRDEAGNREFNPPSLRGVSQGGPYFHDGRAATLQDVFETHRHQIKDGLKKGELTDLLAFLKSL